eukprot:1625812-Amphidinium_carterae.1
MASQASETNRTRPTEDRKVKRTQNSRTTNRSQNPWNQDSAEPKGEPTKQHSNGNASNRASTNEALTPRRHREEDDAIFRRDDVGDLVGPPADDGIFRTQGRVEVVVVVLVVVVVVKPARLLGRLEVDDCVDVVVILLSQPRLSRSGSCGSSCVVVVVEPARLLGDGHIE